MRRLIWVLAVLLAASLNMAHAGGTTPTIVAAAVTDSTIGTTTSEIYKFAPTGSNRPLIAFEKINSAGTMARTAQGNPGNRKERLAT